MANGGAIQPQDLNGGDGDDMKDEHKEERPAKKPKKLVISSLFLQDVKFIIKNT